MTGLGVKTIDFGKYIVYLSVGSKMLCKSGMQEGRFKCSAVGLFYSGIN